MPADSSQNAWITRVLGITVASPTAGGGRDEADASAAGAGVRLAKALLVWNATRAHVARQVTQLQQAIAAASEDEAEFDEIVANLGNLEEVLELLDDSLTEKLGELRGATDPAVKNALSAEARKIVARFQARVAGNELIQGIDANGFVPLDIKPRVEQALGAVLATI